jgi:hypothetical protein
LSNGLMVRSRRGSFEPSRTEWPAMKKTPPGLFSRAKMFSPQHLKQQGGFVPFWAARLFDRARHRSSSRCLTSCRNFKPLLSNGLMVRGRRGSFGPSKTGQTRPADPRSKVPGWTDRSEPISQQIPRWGSLRTGPLQSGHGMTLMTIMTQLTITDHDD